MGAGEKGSKMCMRYDYIQLNFGNIQGVSPLTVKSKS